MNENKSLKHKQNPLSQPILAVETLTHYLNRGLAQKAGGSGKHRYSSLDRSGAHLSRFRGSGFDYDDSRAYQPGDDLRNINWRLMARTSELFTKLFKEEREASVMLVIDRRAMMRFGTRSCLKVTRAVQIAAYLAGVALAQSCSVGFALLQTSPQTISPQRHRDRVLHGLMAAASACPPQLIEDETVSMSLLLKRLQLMTSAGCRLILLSDFHDMHDPDVIILTHLASQHPLQAIQILDPLEMNLPERGNWLIDQFPGGVALEVNANNEQVKQQYQNEMDIHHARIESLFSQCQVPFIKTRTDVPFDDLIRQISNGG